MVFPIVALSICALAGIGYLIYDRMKPKKKANQTNMAEKTANEFIHVRDIRGNFLITREGMALSYLRVTPISIDLLSHNEQKLLMRRLSAEMASMQSEFQFLAASRPVDISAIIMDYQSRMADAEPKRRELLKMETMQMNSYAISGDIVERQFYIVMWNTGDDEGQRELLGRVKQMQTNFLECGVDCEILTQQEIVRLCNLIHNPGYVHMEDAETEASIPVIDL